MKKLIKQILQEEEREKKFNSASKLMEKFIEGYEWVAKDNVLFLYNEQKHSVILYVEQKNIDNNSLYVHTDLTDLFMKYLSMTYSEFEHFIFKWCLKNTDSYVDDIFEFDKHISKRLANKIYNS